MTHFPGPKDSYLAYAADIDAGIRRVLDSGWYILGDEVEAFEQEFASFVGAAGAIGVGSGTDALVVALRALGVGTGDLVATVSHTAVATVAAIEMTGAEALLVDIDDTMTMDAESLRRSVAATRPPAAIIPVHLYGQPADLSGISAVAAEYGSQLLEDCSQAHGAECDGRSVGTWGAAGAFSCYPTKNLGALGDAGVLVGSEEVLAKARMIRQYGWRERYISDVPGINTRLDPVQAAVLRAKLMHLEADNRRRQEIASRYDSALRGLVRVPTPLPGTTHVYHQYVVRTPDRDSLRDALAAAGVPTAVLYPAPVHLQPAYRGRVATDPAGLPMSERVVDELLCLPIHPQMSTDAADVVCVTVREWAARR